MGLKPEATRRIGIALPDRPRRRRIEREAPEQVRLVALLRATGLPFSGSLNGVRLSQHLAAAAKAAGMEAGDPDLVIWRSPPARPECKGFAIELKQPDLKPKTDRAGRWSGARPHQQERLEMLEAEGWWCVVAYGFDDAVQHIRAAGYPLPFGGL